MALINYLFLIILGLLPSFIWLLFFLEKDVHPEPKRIILKVFLWGMASTLPIILVAIFLIWFEVWEDLKNIVTLSIVILTFYILFWATVEEVLKYLVVKISVLKNSELDEPTDIMLYMIIAGLGFAAFENILILFGAHPVLQLPEILFLAWLRFISATILHALCSGIIGYFWALSFYETKKRGLLIFAGIGIASLLHWFYNFSIMVIGGWLGFLFMIITLISLAVFVSLGFKRLKKLKSVCKL